MILRELRWADFEALVESYWELYDARDRGEPFGIPLFAVRPSQEEEAAWFATLFRRTVSGDGIAVVAEVDGRAVGLCEIRPTSPGGRGSEGGHVGELGILIDHRHRGRGLGRAMIRRALELAPARFEIVRLWVFANNDRAKRLYVRLGFTAAGRLPSVVRRGTTYFDEELMYVDLRHWRPPDPGANR
ncbi:MAG: N-acetyltransferase family protein [Thermoplasmata archaeon]